MIKKSVEFANLVLNLEGTLKSLKDADAQQKDTIRDCIEQIKVLTAVVEGQEKWITSLEARLMTLSLRDIEHSVVHENSAPMQPLLAMPKQKAKRAPKRTP